MDSQETWKCRVLAVFIRAYLKESVAAHRGAFIYLWCFIDAGNAWIFIYFHQTEWKVKGRRRQQPSLCSGSHSATRVHNRPNKTEWHLHWLRHTNSCRSRTKCLHGNVSRRQRGRSPTLHRQFLYRHRDKATVTPHSFRPLVFWLPPRKNKFKACVFISLPTRCIIEQTEMTEKLHSVFREELLHNVIPKQLAAL